MIKLYLTIVGFITFIKLSFFHSYVSTDFEVHRNWLALTFNLPIRNWYLDSTSMWTLDYPPFFAWFEYMMSHIAVKFDRNMTDINNLNYISYETKLFQKLSVILSDFIYILAIYKIICCKPISKHLHDSLFGVLTSLKLLAPFGLLFIDHIHFQYNGILFGLLFLSIANLMKNRYLWAAFWFAVLLNCKHIYIYYAPAFGTYLFFHYCFVAKVNEIDKSTQNQFDYKRFLHLAAIVIAVFLISFGPFIAMGQLNQVLSRLFPFDYRGLTHAYWAPNIWALYNSIDMVLSRIARIFHCDSNLSNDMTKGLVETYEHLILPNIKPMTTLTLTIASLLPSLIKCRYTKSTNEFFKLLIISGWSSFIFGWHVHEKAILMITLPLMILENLDLKCLGFGFYITTISHYSLLPLVATKPEYMLKIALFLACTCTHYVQISYTQEGNVIDTIPRFSKLHLSMLIPIWILSDFILPVFLPKFQFLPLMLTSLFCGVGLLFGFIRFYLYYWTGNEKWIFTQNKSRVSDIKKEQ